MIKSGTKIKFTKTLYSDMGPIAFKNETGTIGRAESDTEPKRKTDGFLYQVFIDTARPFKFTFASSDEFETIDNAKLN